MIYAAPPPDESIDADTGCHVMRLSRLPGQSESFYFHQNAFTASGDKMVFANTGTNHARDFVVLDWHTHAIERLTDGGTNRGEVVCFDIGPLIRGGGAPRVLWKLDMVAQFDVFHRSMLMGTTPAARTPARRRRRTVPLYSC